MEWSSIGADMKIFTSYVLLMSSAQDCCKTFKKLQGGCLVLEQISLFTKPAVLNMLTKNTEAVTFKHTLLTDVSTSH